ncbi:MAG: class I SAM-dependent methyltransferase, partial [Bacteroidales bacterium]
LVYALDMFHMVKDTDGFLAELRRLTKPDGVLYLEDGHQPRSMTREKVLKSGCWEVTEEPKRFITCKPKLL